MKLIKIGRQMKKMQYFLQNKTSDVTFAIDVNKNM